MFNYYCHQDKLERNVLYTHTVYLSQLDQVRLLHTIAALIYV